MNFDNLTPTLFENLCFDILQVMGCKNANWRKGTDYENSPADSGRDIECDYYRYDPLLGEMVINGSLSVKDIRVVYHPKI